MPGNATGTRATGHAAAPPGPARPVARQHTSGSRRMRAPYRHGLTRSAAGCPATSGGSGTGRSPAGCDVQRPVVRIDPSQLLAGQAGQPRRYCISTGLVLGVALMALAGALVGQFGPVASATCTGERA